MRKIIDEQQNRWKVVLVKTIDHVEPIYYRLANLYNYSIKTVPAYRIFDEVFNSGMNIVNLKCNNNKAVLIDEQGYESNSDVIIVDEFDDEVPNLWDYCLEDNKMNSEILDKYDKANVYSPSNYRIDSEDKLAWTCENNHTIRCCFATYLSTNGRCPICELEKNGETPSLAYWAGLTGNKDILRMYDMAPDNTDLSKKINYRAHKKVWFRNPETDEVVVESLCDVTVGNKKLPFKENKKQVNLKR